MKDRIIFLISSIIVIFGIIYLSITSFNFVNRNASKNTSTNAPTTSLNEKAKIVLLGESNNEIIAENLAITSPVTIKASIKNESESLRYSDSFEGRVYKIKDLLNFPNTDSEVPVETKSILVSVNASESTDVTYTTNAKECGNFYIALGDKDFWQRGRGVVSYGFYSVKCNVEPAVQVTPAQTKSPMADKVLGTNSTTKGGNVLPKSGAGESIQLLFAGIASFLMGVVYRVKKRI